MLKLTFSPWKSADYWAEKKAGFPNAELSVFVGVRRKIGEPAEFAPRTLNLPKNYFAAFEYLPEECFWVRVQKIHRAIKIRAIAAIRAGKESVEIESAEIELARLEHAEAEEKAKRAREIDAEINAITFPLAIKLSQD